MAFQVLPKIPSRHLGPVLASLAYATLFFALWPTSRINDDGAIALRYMDNFARGYFFTYNVGDGPVFGLSGFVHGLFAGGLAFTHLLSPLASLLASNFVGLALVVFFSFRLLHDAFSSTTLAAVSSLVLLTASPSFLTSIRMGLETPLHLAIILGMLLAWTHSREILWPLLTLSVISKLDAAPVALLVGLVAILETLGRSGGAGLKATLRPLLLFGILPLVVWVVFATLCFGSPLPQSAYSKFVFHRHPSDLLTFARKLGWLWPIVGAIVIVGAVRITTAPRHGLLRTMGIAIYVLAAAAMVAEYTLFNPSEAHTWYYAIPEYLVLLQLLVITGFLIAEDASGRVRRSLYPLVILLVVYVCVPRVITAVRNTVRYVKTVEAERIRIGQWIRSAAAPTDTLLTGHGHIAERAGLYTYDYSGLNSRRSTALGNDKGLLLRTYRPTWFVQSGLSLENGAPPRDYVLKKSFYDISHFGSSRAWRLFERSDRPLAIRYLEVGAPLMFSNGSCDVNPGLRVDASIIDVTVPEEAARVVRFRAGIVLRPDAAEPECWGFPADGGPEQRMPLHVSRPDDDGLPAGYTREIVVEAGAGDRMKSIRIRAAGGSGKGGPPLRLIEPVIEYSSDPDAGSGV